MSEQCWSTGHDLCYQETESSVTLVDVDGDGLEDVLVGVTSFQQFEAVKNAPGHTMKQRCLALRK